MKFTEMDIPGLILIEPRVYEDSRGYFLESYNERIFRKSGISADFVQDNISNSVKGTLRGLHYQIDPHAQAKLVRVTNGAVFDVAVDIRLGSSTFGKWTGIELSEENKWALFIPAGFAHGFYVLSEIAQFTYKCTAFYTPDADRGIIWNDEEIGIDWPLEGEPVISEKDKKLPTLRNADINFPYESR